MLEQMTKEDLIEVIKGLQDDVYHLKMGWKPGTPKPSGYATPATAPGSQAPEGWALPSERSGQIPSNEPIGVRVTMEEMLGGTPTPATKAEEKIASAVETIVTFQEEQKTSEDTASVGWCIRITHFEGFKFLFLRSPDDRSMTLEVDTRTELNGRVNRPMVLSQFINAVGEENIEPFWPQWWKIDEVLDGFVLSRSGTTCYTITPKNPDQWTLVKDFVRHLNSSKEAGM